MKAYPIHRMIHLGTVVRYLQDTQANAPIHGEGYTVNNLDIFFRELERLGLKVTQQATHELALLATELRQSPQDQRLTVEQVTRLRDYIGYLRETLLAEASTFNAYILTEKRMDARRLVEKPESFLRQETFAKLPPVAHYDIKQAGKCIAFETPTAGAFHLLRATEDTLRAYYQCFIKRSRLSNPTWGDVIKALRTRKRKPKPDKTLLDHLDNIRFNFRNPTDHPEMIYGMDEVQDLFPLVADVLNRMARELS